MNIEIKNQNNMIKTILTLKEVSELTGLSKSTLYKITHQNKIPFYKPNGKNIYFKRDEVEEFLTSKRVSSIDELEREASKYLLTKKGA